MTQSEAAELFDPSAPGFTEDPYPFYDRLRAAQPLHRTRGVWLATRHEEVLAILRDRRFSSRNLTFGSATAEPIPAEALGALEEVLLVGVLVFSDPPDHSRLRRLSNRAFVPKIVQGMRPRIEQIVDSLLDDVVGAGSMDVVSSLALPLPLIVICDMLGVPLTDRDLFAGWMRDIMTVSDPNQTAEAMGRSFTALQSLREYFRDLIAARRKTGPRGDVLDELAAEEEGDRLTEGELLGTCQTLFIAGHETTASFIGNAILALLRHPDQLQLLREDPSLIKNAVEELLRYDTSVQIAPAPRVAMEDVDLGEQTIRKGEAVRLFLGAVNRDPAQFPDPHRLDLTRSEPYHLSFAGGIHTCLGAPLARLEVQIAISSLLKRMERLELASDHLEWEESGTIRALKALPVTF